MIFDVKKRAVHLADFARTCPNAATHAVVIAECDFCGYLDWSRSSVADKPSVAVERMDPGGCQRCNSVRVRNPEVFNWVLSVLIKHEQGGGHSEQGLQP